MVQPIRPEPSPSAAVRSAALVACIEAGLGMGAHSVLLQYRDGALFMALVCGAHAKRMADAGRELDSANLYRHREALLQYAAAHSPRDSWRLGEHAYKREGRPEEHAPAQTVIQFLVAGFGWLSFHNLQAPDTVAAELVKAGAAEADVEHARSVAAPTWDGVALQPIANNLLCAYARGGVAAALAHKLRARRKAGK